jgi:hypothetical protein
MTAEALHDRPADGQPDAHAATLRGIERFEEHRGGLSVEPDPGVYNGQANMAVFVESGSNQQQPWTVFDIFHRLRSVSKQI